MIQERLQHEHAKQARLESQYKATIADLEHKVKSGTATTEEKIQHQHAKIAKEEGEGGQPDEVCAQNRKHFIHAHSP